MHNNLYEFACDELQELDEKARKGETSLNDIQYADMLEHYKKSHLTNRAMLEGGYSERAYPGRYNDRSYDDGRDGASMARGRMNPPRDSMGRYSGRGYAYDNGFADAIRKAMPMAPDEQSRIELERMAARVDRM